MKRTGDESVGICEACWAGHSDPCEAYTEPGGDCLCACADDSKMVGCPPSRGAIEVAYACGMPENMNLVDAFKTLGGLTDLLSKHKIEETWWLS